ncbi:hypothetical protein [Xylophilus sp. ASV27]|nr:hypothetical protein [Xylophilus sp. ASV27]
MILDVGEIAASSSLTGFAAHAGYAGSFGEGVAVALAAQVVAA